MPAASREVVIAGGGPAGLIAAELLAAVPGVTVTVVDRMRVPARKLVMAGRGGLNLTNDEPLDAFLDRYASSTSSEPDAAIVRRAVAAFPPGALRAWAESLGEPTFVGTSRRVFPESFHARGLLRAWLARLQTLGVRFVIGVLDDVEPTSGPEGAAVAVVQPQGRLRADAVLLALGGASWPRLGADGGWVAMLRGRGVRVRDLRPANCGVRVAWSGLMARHAGEPLKNLAVTVCDRTVRGEAMVTVDGLEGGVVYALGRELRSELDAGHAAVLHVDLRPDRERDELERQLARVPASTSLSNRLRRIGLSPAAAALVREGLAGGRSAAQLAGLVKDVPITVTATAGMERAISSAGGIALDELDDGFMLRRLPGVFAAGEMLDWEAPTGGYLLQACFATGAAAARGIARHLGLDEIAVPGQALRS